MRIGSTKTAEASAARYSEGWAWRSPSCAAQAFREPSRATRIGTERSTPLQRRACSQKLARSDRAQHARRRHGLRSKNRRRRTRPAGGVKGAVRTHGLGCCVGRPLALTGAGWGGLALRALGAHLADLRAQEVDLHRPQRAPRAELLKLAGLAAGQNLFALDVAALERAMAAHPWVRTVEVTRHFPSRVSVRGGGARAGGAGGAGRAVPAGRGGRALQAGAAGRRAGPAAGHRAWTARRTWRTPDAGARALPRGAGGGARLRGAQARQPRARCPRCAWRPTGCRAGDRRRARRCGWARATRRRSSQRLARVRARARASAGSRRRSSTSTTGPGPAGWR